MLPIRFPSSIGKAADIPALHAVNAFADRVAELSWAAWLSIGQSLVEGAPGSTLRSTARAILEATINDAGLAVAAWYARDAIETSAHYAWPAPRRWTSAERRCFAAAHTAAEDAGLAILACELISAEDFDVLCAPFASLVEAAARTAA
jgi:hypothetical protein